MVHSSIELHKPLQHDKAVTMKETRDLFKKIRNIKRTFHVNMGTVKDRNGEDLTEAEEIKKRCQEHTEELYTKDLYCPSPAPAARDLTRRKEGCRQV